MHNIIVHLDPCIVSPSKTVKPFNPLYSHFLLLFTMAHILQNFGPLFYLFEEIIISMSVLPTLNLPVIPNLKLHPIKTLSFT